MVLRSVSKEKARPRSQVLAYCRRAAIAAAVAATGASSAASASASVVSKVLELSLVLLLCNIPTSSTLLSSWLSKQSLSDIFFKNVIFSTQTTQATTFEPRGCDPRGQH